QVDINPDLPEDERSRLQALIGHMGVCFNSIPGIVREPEKDYIRIPVPPEIEAQLKQTPPYPLGKKAREIVDMVFDKNREYGRMTDVPPQGSPYSLAVFVATKDRPVIDIRPLNAIVPGDAYPLPRQEDVTSRLK